MGIFVERMRNNDGPLVSGLSFLTAVLALLENLIRALAFGTHCTRINREPLVHMLRELENLRILRAAERALILLRALNLAS